MVVFSGTSSWSVHFQCRGGSSFKLLRGLSLPTISRQGGGGWQDLFPAYKQCIYLIFKWEEEEGGGGGSISTMKSINGDIDNHENLINQV